MISCVLPPTAGPLEVLGMPVTEHPRRIKARMGVVPQEDNLDEEITVLDNLLIYARYFGLKSGERAARAREELLEFVQLIEKRDWEIRGSPAG